MKKLIFLLSVLITFQACSWQEYFVISNQTNKDIIIEYEIESPSNGFPIFDNHPTIYKLSKEGDIDWNEVTEVNDTDTSKYSIKIILEPNKAIIIGHLSNDKYNKHNQYFINGRHFNLKKLKVEKEKTITEISPENFDDYFVKKNGMIILRMK